MYWAVGIGRLLAQLDLRADIQQGSGFCVQSAIKLVNPKTHYFGCDAASLLCIWSPLCALAQCPTHNIS